MSLHQLRETAEQSEACGMAMIKTRDLRLLLDLFDAMRRLRASASQGVPLNPHAWEPVYRAMDTLEAL